MTVSPELIKLLANDLRWKMLKAMTSGDFKVQELVKLIGEPFNLVSYHLRQLREQQLVVTRRSDADGRDVYYGVDLNHLSRLYAEAGQSLHAALRTPYKQYELQTPQISKRVLFLCTHNSARSQMAEGILRHLVGENIGVVSAGNKPNGVHPYAVEVLAARGIDIRAQVAKHMQDIDLDGFDYVITVCDRVREICPTPPRAATQLHWSLPDPVAVVGSEDQKRAAFTTIADHLMSRIQYFLMELKA
jgi:ArsR family transcriptional regulator, arsenate/arsenite/antimonite-responsive transcriptional repressor / arsenate reductase (thioredoxin)